MDQVTHHRRNRARVWLVVWLLCGFAAHSRGQTAGQAVDSPLEYQVKAAFLLNFAKFVEWPAAASGGVDSPLVICVWGKDPFGHVLDEIVQGETINGRRMTIQRPGEPSGLQACQVVFIGQSEKEIPKILGGIGRGVLTVGEGDEFLMEGGMIALVIDKRRVRFDINQAAAARAGLTLSSRLLTVARTVEK
jgi:YfiR/HmsC-like